MKILAPEKKKTRLELCSEPWRERRPRKRGPWYLLICLDPGRSSRLSVWQALDARGANRNESSQELGCFMLCGLGGQTRDSFLRKSRPA